MSKVISFPGAAPDPRPHIFNLAAPFESDLAFLGALRSLGADVSNESMLEAMAQDLFRKARGVLRAEWDGNHYLIFILDMPAKDGSFMLVAFDCDEEGYVANWANFYRLFGRDVTLSMGKLRLMLANFLLLYQDAERLILDMEKLPSYEIVVH